MADSKRDAKAIHEEISLGRARALLFSLLTVIILALIVCGYLFISSNNGLRQAIQTERMDYVEEISRRIITGQRFMIDEYSGAIANYAAIIDRADINSIEDVRACLPARSADEVLLLNSAGKIFDMSGRAVYLPNRELIEKLMTNDGVVQQFTSLNYNEDCWMFAVRMEPFSFGGDEYIAVVLAVSADDFGEELAVSLFDGYGASYIIRNDGSIEIKPDGANLAFDGYNLFTSMEDMGVSRFEIEALKKDIAENSRGSTHFSVNGADWLISHSDSGGDSSIVVAVPLTVTAAMTYEGLSDTILFAVITVLLVFMIALALILYFSYRDKLRTRSAMAVAAKSDFFSKMSHDIRTPLNAVIGLELLAKDCSDNPQVKEYLQQSSFAANYLLGILNDVLDMTRIESGKLSVSKKPFDMNDVISGVRSIAMSMAAEKSLMLEVEIDSPFDTEYLGDEIRVKQILMNLMSNATKFTKSGGSVKLAVSHKTGADGLDIVTMIVSDTGIGMSNEYLSRIFLPFEQEQSSYTQQFSGSGLGLSIVHSLVSMMNGTIKVESKEGVGTTFTVILPFERGGGVTRAHTGYAAGPSVSFEGRRVLLAEDNAINRQVAVSILKKKFDLAVDEAKDGMQAIEMFAGSGEGYYSIVLMDVRMPEVDGLEATRRIRALGRGDAKTVPIVALSANAFEEDVAVSLDAGMNDYLSKPIDIAALNGVLHKYIGREGVAS